jgi:hypothetical protein
MIQTDARIIMLFHCGFVTDNNVGLVGEKSVTIFEERMCNGIIDRNEIVEIFNDNGRMSVEVLRIQVSRVV